MTKFFSTVLILLFSFNIQADNTVFPHDSFNPSDLYPSVDQQAFVDLETIINIGKPVWDILVANKGTAEYETATANAIPKAAKRWDDLSTWKSYTSEEVVITLKTKFKVITAGQIKGNFFYDYAGSYDGRGYYLKNIRFIPSEVNTFPGFDLKLSINMSEPANYGSSEQPIAGMRATLTATIYGPFNEKSLSGTFEIRGDGTFAVRKAFK